MIFIGHFIQQNDHITHDIAPFLILSVSQYWSGVDLFFVISGFVIFLSLHRQEDGLSGLERFKSYFLSRAFRVLPAYILLILLYFYIPYGNRLMNSDLFISSLPSQVYLFFGQSWWMVASHRSGAPFVQPTWSLCAEVFLYAVAFVVVICAPKKHLVKIVAALAVVSLASRLYIVAIHGDLYAAYLLPICRMDGFMFGGIIALLYSDGRLAAIPTAALNAVVLICLLCFVAFSAFGVDIFSRFAIGFVYAFYVVFFGALVARATRGGLRFLAHGLLKRVGLVSYFIYLFHFPVIYGVSHIPTNLLFKLVITIGIVYGSANLSWRWLEKPLIDRGKALSKNSGSGESRLALSSR